MFLEILELLLNDACPVASQKWDALATWACHHGLGPFLFHHFKNQTKACILPRTVETRLQQAYYSAQAAALVQEQTWIELLNAFKTAGILVLVLKGVALAYTVYPDPVLRPMGDMDLLIHPDHVSQAAIILKQLGFEPKPEPLKRINPFNTRWTGESSFVRKLQGAVVSVDLHWQLLTIEWLRHVVKVDLGPLWEHAIPFSLGQAVARTLACEDMLLHTCLHLSLHGFTHFRGYVDILQLLKRGNLDWQLFVQRARTNGLRLTCYFPLWWIAQYCTSIVPKEVLVALRPDPLRMALGKWLIRQGVQREPDAGHTWNHVVQMLIVNRCVDYGRLLVWLLFPGRTWLQERYNLQTLWQQWLYSLLHPLVVMWEGASSLGTLFKQLIHHCH